MYWSQWTRQISQLRYAPSNAEVQDFMNQQVENYTVRRLGFEGYKESAVNQDTGEIAVG